MDDLMGLLSQAEAEAKQSLERLQAARRALEGKEKPGRKPVSASAEAPKPKARRRRKRANTRADQALALIQENPKITAGEIAKQMKIKPNYLYRVMSDLEKSKKVKKDGRTYTAV